MTTTTPTPTGTDPRPVDADGRVVLPPGFANATVVIEAVSDTELRVRKTAAPAPGEVSPLAPLSDRDWDMFLDLLDNPPEPTPALRAAAAHYKERYA